MAIAPTNINDLRIPGKTDDQVINAVVEQYKKVWHGEKPDQVIFDKIYSDGSVDVRAVLITRDSPKITLFHVSPNLYTSRL